MTTFTEGQPPDEPTRDTMAVIELITNAATSAPEGTIAGILGMGLMQYYAAKGIRIDLDTGHSTLQEVGAVEVAVRNLRSQEAQRGQGPYILPPYDAVRENLPEGLRSNVADLIIFFKRGRKRRY